MPWAPGRKKTPKTLPDRRTTRAPTTGQHPALGAARRTSGVSRLLDRLTATQTVELRERYGLGWKRRADAVRGTPDAQSSIRRKYQSGLRYLGRTDSGRTDS